MLGLNVCIEVHGSLKVHYPCPMQCDFARAALMSAVQRLLAEGLPSVGPIMVEMAHRHLTSLYSSLHGTGGNQRLVSAYRATLGINPPFPPPPPAPPQPPGLPPQPPLLLLQPDSDSSSKRTVLAVAVGVPVGAALLLLLAAIITWRQRQVSEAHHPRLVAPHQSVMQDMPHSREAVNATAEHLTCQQWVS